MREIDVKDIESLGGRKLEPGDEFRFECRPDLDCFGRCCRNLNLFLYPYDVARLRKCLGISSGEFIERYTDVVLRENSFFPDVLLSMADNEQATCPFLTDRGCTVYPDRPDACRTFPAEIGMLFTGDENMAEPVVFFRPPEFCLGRHEERQWTISSWAENQKAVMYHKMTTEWAWVKALFFQNPWQDEGPEGRRAKMAFMAAYNPDEFRQFVFGSTFLSRFDIPANVRKKIKKDDRELLLFAFDFIRVTLFGLPARRVRPGR